MGADLSRIRSNPLLDFAGVDLKQGGVLLDADFNELAAITDRRIRAAASDILGRSRVSSTTPDAFRITAAAGGSLAIGKGRLYVDGLLAECHGGPADDATKKQLDALMAEPAFPDPLDYARQPFLAAPPALPGARRHLVYLDVWDREVTHLEWPAVVEPAVNVETSSRRQVVWQVRVLGDSAAGVDCASAEAAIPGWAAVIAPSSARLTTGTYDPPPAADPCELPPTGGYRGLENQTYRVEVHDSGLPGAGATFKWSRDNASVGSRVTVIVEKGRLELASLGRDDLLRFNTGDWVEIIDDPREQSQLCGELRRITVDEAARTIAFTPDLPAGMLPAAGAALRDPAFPRARNLRVRRWDHKRQVMRLNAAGQASLFHDLDAAGAAGAIPVPPAGTTLVLENGLTVQFAAVGAGNFRAGDYWVFTARTADASVEALRNEPPRGIHHHYARLGIWDVGTGVVTDCRPHWPPPTGGGEEHNCGCTRCVTPESHASNALTIQAAVDFVHQRGGGTVCIGVGQYRLPKAVVVQKATSMRIRGEGPGTVLVASEGGAFFVTESAAVVLEDLSIVSAAGAHAIQVRTCFGLTLQRLLVTCFAESDATAAIGLSGAVIGAAIRDNVIMARDGIVSGEATAPAGGAQAAGVLFSAALRIEDNLLLCARAGIRFAGAAIHLMSHVVERNQLVGGSEAAISLLGVGAPSSSMHIRDNDISASGNGINAGVDALWIEDNRITGDSKGATGAAILLSPGLDRTGPDECIVSGNQIRGFARGGIVITSITRELVAKQNVVAGCGMGISIEGEGRVGNASIDNNHLADIDSGGKNEIVAGIAVMRAESVSVSGNIVCRVGGDGAQSLVAGIVAFDVERLRLSGNCVTDIAPAGDFNKFNAAGILVRAPFTSVDVQHNQVERESTRRGQANGMFTALWIGDPNLGEGAVALAGKATGHTTVTASARTMVFGVLGQPYVKDSTNPIGGGNAATPNVSVIENTLGSRGLLTAAYALVEGDCVFGHNRCELQGGGHAVHLTGDAVIVNGNRVIGGETSIRIDCDEKRATVVGNITSATISLGGAALVAPWSALNVNA